MKNIANSTLPTFLLATLSMFFAIAVNAAEVNVYSYRQPQLIKPLFDAFSKKTGIKVKAINAKTGLIERLKLEGKNSPADILLTTDISSLTDTKRDNLTAPVKSKVINNAIPAHLRDPEGHWFGVTRRARIIVASKDRVKEGEITSYRELGLPRWKGRICTRSGKHKYNIALFSSQIVHKGEAWTKEWLKGLKANLAKTPQGNDRAQIRAVASGECDLAVVNSYYMFVMLSDPKQSPDAKKVNIIYPDQQGKGTHMNISGMSMAKYAPNRKEALQLMEFLVSDEAQKIYANIVGEYPAAEGVTANKLVQSWGEFSEDKLSLADIANQRVKAIEMVNSVGYDK